MISQGVVGCGGGGSLLMTTRWMAFSWDTSSITEREGGKWDIGFGGGER